MNQAVTDAEVEAAVLGIGEVGELGFVSGSLVQKVLEAFAASRAAPAQPVAEPFGIVEGGTSGKEAYFSIIGGGDMPPVGTRFYLGQPPSQIAEPATTVDAALTQEPEFYTAFASQGSGFVPLPGFSNETEKGVKNLVLEHARGTGYKGTVNGYLLQQGWVVLPVFATPQPAASVASRGEAEVIAAARAVIDEFGSSMDGPLQRLYQALRTHDAATAQLQPRTPDAPKDADSRDGKILDWLELRLVNVRDPLRYGSRDMFWATPQEEEGRPDGPSDLRARVLAAIQAKERAS